MNPARWMIATAVAFCLAFPVCVVYVIAHNRPPPPAPVVVIAPRDPELSALRDAHAKLLAEVDAIRRAATIPAIQQAVKVDPLDTLIDSVRAQMRERAEVPDEPLTPERIFKSSSSSVCTIIADTGLEGRQGSGFFISDDGLLVTNYHVVSCGPDAADVILGNGKKYKAKSFVAVDKQADLVILKVEGRFNALSLQAKLPAIGEKALTIGSPKGLQLTISQGIVSAFRDHKGQVFIQTDAPISHGSSGGPLLSMRGEVIGVMSESDPRGQNLNFAIPAFEVQRLWDDMRAPRPLSTFATD